MAYAMFLRQGDDVNSNQIDRKHGSIKTYLGAITATCIEFNCTNIPHSRLSELKEKMAESKESDKVQCCNLLRHSILWRTSQSCGVQFGP